jgi:hypothetical protein
MWVEVVGKDGPYFIGTLTNRPLNQRLSHGMRVAFLPEHIVSIHDKPVQKSGDAVQSGLTSSSTASSRVPSGEGSEGTKRMNRIDWTNRKKCETAEELEEAISDLHCDDPEFEEALGTLIRSGMLVDTGLREDGMILWDESEATKGLTFEEVFRGTKTQ